MSSSTHEERKEMSTTKLSPEARDLLAAAIDGYLDHDLDHSLEEAERAISSSRPTEWSQDDLDRLLTDRQRLLELHAALKQGEIELTGRAGDFSGALVSAAAPVEPHWGRDVGEAAYEGLSGDQQNAYHQWRTMKGAAEETIVGPAKADDIAEFKHLQDEVDGAPTAEAQSGPAEPANGGYIHEELVLGYDGIDTTLVIEEIGDEFQVYSQERTPLIGGGHTPGKTGDVAQFPTYSDAKDRLMEIKNELEETHGARTTEHAETPVRMRAKSLSPSTDDGADGHLSVEQSAALNQSQHQQSPVMSGPGVG